MPEILAADDHLMKLSGINAVSLGIFAWAAYEPSEGNYQFGWLDERIEALHRNGIQIFLATPSGGKPAWLARKYPEIRRVNAEGRREPQQERHNFCYTSPIYREKLRAINTKLAKRYAAHPAVIGWHISNEYSGITRGATECYCPQCFKAFQDWLKQRYTDLETLNRTWWSRFWSKHFTAWEQIEFIDADIHGMVIDWKRFVTARTIDFMLAEIDAVHQYEPKLPTTTNLMGDFQLLDNAKLAAHVDFISWDAYPTWHKDSDESEQACWTAFHHDRYRSIKGGQPFLMLESTPSGTNWWPVCRSKRPGMHALSSVQAIAHGSEGVLYFQWRQSRGSSEKFHGAVVSHAGHENTRTFRDVQETSALLGKLDGIPGTSVKPDVAVLYDAENAWAIESAQGPRNRDKNYLETVREHHRQFWLQSVPVDIIDSEASFASYRLLVCPMLYMVKKGVAERLRTFAEQGGTLVFTYLSGLVDESDLCFLGGFPGPLRELCGLWVEENDTLWDHGAMRICPEEANDLELSGTYQARHYADILHLEGAETLATYGDDFYAGQPALTRNRIGKGEVYYVASRNDERFLADFFSGLTARAAISPALAAKLPTGVTATLRGDGNTTHVFIMNFTHVSKKIDLVETTWKDVLTGEHAPQAFELPPLGYKILTHHAPIS